MKVSFVLAHDEPCFAGHFPGNPMVPGVVLLDLVARALMAQTPGAEVCGVVQAKFAGPLRPGEPLHIECQELGDGAHAQFRCHSGERLVAEGVLLLRHARP